MKPLIACPQCGNSQNLETDRDQADYSCEACECDWRIDERIERIIREWPHWSRAERRRMPELVAEILEHCRNGTGNAFVREWCKRNLKECFA